MSVCVVLGSFFECESSRKGVRDFPSQVRCFYNFQSLIVPCVHILILPVYISAAATDILQGMILHLVFMRLPGSSDVLVSYTKCKPYFGITWDESSTYWGHNKSSFRTKVSYWYRIQFTRLTFPGIKLMLHKFTAGWFLSLSCS